MGRSRKAFSAEARSVTGGSSDLGFAAALA
jgi:hypothetical protein